jgi:hypothetical protein
MAVCNSCGATLTDGVPFCGKCAATNAISTKPSATSRPSPPPSKAFKLVLIVIGVIVFCGIIGIVTLGVIAHRLHGTTENLKDPEQAVKNLGVDIYPGAQAQPGDAASFTFGGMHAINVRFTSSDPINKVCAFYSSDPALQPTTVSGATMGNHCTIVSDHKTNRITINVNSNTGGAGSWFQVTGVAKKSTTSN